MSCLCHFSTQILINANLQGTIPYAVSSLDCGCLAEKKRGFSRWKRWAKKWHNCSLNSPQHSAKWRLCYSSKLNAGSFTYNRRQPFSHKESTQIKFPNPKIQKLILRASNAKKQMCSYLFVQIAVKTHGIWKRGRETRKCWLVNYTVNFKPCALKANIWITFVKISIGVK